MTFANVLIDAHISFTNTVLDVRLHCSSYLVWAVATSSRRVNNTYIMWRFRPFFLKRYTIWKGTWTCDFSFGRRYKKRLCLQCGLHYSYVAKLASEGMSPTATARVSKFPVCAVGMTSLLFCELN